MTDSGIKLWTRDFYNAVDPKVVSSSIHIAKPGWTKTVPEAQVLIPDFDVWYIFTGKGKVQINNQWHEFETGDLITIKPNGRYQKECTGNNPFHSIWMHLLPFGTKDHPLDPVLADVWPTKMSLLHRPKIAELFTNFFDAHALDSEENVLASKGLLLQILDILFDELQSIPIHDKPRAYRNLLLAKQFIEVNYAKPIKLADITEYCGLGSSQLSNLFKRQTGYSPIEYLIHIRIREAKLLLAHGERVKKVAHVTGFESENYFSQIFKKKIGISPTAFASKHTRPASRTKN